MWHRRQERNGCLGKRAHQPTLYLDIAFESWSKKGRMATYADLAEAVDHGAVQRIRPKMMTVTAILASLVPILWASGAGADVMRRIAAPMVA